MRPTPSQTDGQPARHGRRVRGRHLVFRDRGTPPHPNSEAHDWAAAFGSDLDPTDSETGEDFRGPQDPAGHLPGLGPERARPSPSAATTPSTARVPVASSPTRSSCGPGEVRTVWFGVGGSASSPADARAQLRKALDDPEEALADKIATRNRIDRRTVVDLPGQPAAGGQRALVQADAGRLRAAGEQPRAAGGRRRPATTRRRRHAGLDALVRRRLAGLHLAVRHRRRVHRVRRGRGRAVRRDQGPPARAAGRVGGDQPRPAARSCTRSPRTARCTSAPTPTRATPTSPRSTRRRWPWSGAGPATRPSCDDLYPASKRAMEFVATLDEDGDGWPGGLGNVERPGMGEEKLDNAVYTIRRLRRPGRHGPARSATTRPGAGRWARPGRCWRSSRTPGGTAATPAPTPTRWSDPDNEKVFQRHWIGLTPTDAVLPRHPRPGRRSAGLPGARPRHPERARAVLLHRHVRAVPHRHRSDLGPGRQPGPPAATRWSRRCRASATSSP